MKKTVWGRFISRLSVLALVTTLAACAGNPAAPSGGAAGGSSSSSSAGTTILTGAWKLQSVTTSDATTVTIDKPELFTLDISDSTHFTARLDCNRGMGSFVLNGDTMSVGAMAITKAYCAETAKVSDLFFSTFFGDQVVAATQSSLVLSSPRGTLRFGRM